MAVEARGVPGNVAYVFPDWGFFTSFCFLTGNRVRYEIDLRPSTFAKLKRDGITEIRVVFWDAGSRRHIGRRLRTMASAQRRSGRSYLGRASRCFIG